MVGADDDAARACYCIHKSMSIHKSYGRSLAQRHNAHSLAIDSIDHRPRETRLAPGYARLKREHETYQTPRDNNPDISFFITDPTRNYFEINHYNIVRANRREFLRYIFDFQLLYYLNENCQETITIITWHNTI